MPRELYTRVSEKFGVSNQVIVCIAELSELQKELSKYLRHKADVDHIAEEIADVEIMIEQMKQLFALDGEVATWRVKKIKRLESYLDG